MKQSESKISKPLVLEIDEAEKEAVAAVNEIMRKHNLPCSFFEPIIAGIHRQLVEGKRNELITASENYKKQMSEERKED